MVTNRYPERSLDTLSQATKPVDSLYGTAVHSMDDRGRIPMPRQLRDAKSLVPFIKVPEDSRIGSFKGVIYLFPESSVKGRTPRTMFRFGTIRLDAQNRVLIPQDLRAGIGGTQPKKRILGMGEYIMILDTGFESDDFGKKEVLNQQIRNEIFGIPSTARIVPLIQPGFPLVRDRIRERVERLDDGQLNLFNKRT